MATRQYIGARYVPLICGDWDNTKEYEALSVVYYNGASYCSKVPVPVGAAITDTNYWILSADYNAQVAQYRQEVLDLIDDYGTELDVNDIKINGKIPSRVLIEGTETFGQGNSASQFTVISEKGDEAFINGTTLSELNGYTGQDTVASTIQMHVHKDGTLIGKRMAVTSVEADGVTVSNNLSDEEDYILNGGIIFLFKEDPYTKPNSDHMSDTYIGVMTGEHTDHKIIVNEWYAHGDTTLTPVVPEDVLYAIPNCHSNLYLAQESVYLDADTPDYVNINGGEGEFWDYKGINFVQKQYVLRRTAADTKYLGLAVRNATGGGIANGTGLQVNGLTNGLAIGNVVSPILIDGSLGRLIPFNNNGVPQLPYIVSGSQLLYTSGAAFELPDDLVADAIITVLNNYDNDSIITPPTGYELLYNSGSTVASIKMSARTAVRFYYVAGTKRFYYLSDNKNKTNEEVLFRFLTAAIELTDLNLDSLSAICFFNNSTESINLTSSLGNIHNVETQSAVASYAIGAKKLCFVAYTGSTFYCMTLN